jgi:hypothetical protein
MDVLERLDEVAALKRGDPAPQWLSGNNGWGSQFSAMCRDAAAEIRRLRSLAGAVSQGPSFQEIRTASKGTTGL